MGELKGEKKEEKRIIFQKIKIIHINSPSCLITFY